MCGFVGVYDRENDFTYDMNNLSKLIYHRGPDAQIFEAIDNKYYLAFDRLAIIDLAGGSQPMHSDDNKITIMCNGEIYNYVELKEKLIKENVEFKTSSDTEVVLRMYEKHGIDMLNQIEGMFAIAIIDTNKEKAFLIRDRFGIKPLYYVQSNDGKYGFASEIKPLLKLPFVTKNIRKESVADFLKYEYVHAPFTIFEDIKKVMAGHYLVVDKNDITDVVYWDCANIQEMQGTNVDECKQEIVRLMRESIKLHLRSDVKLGVFLSGGVDSGLITALASECADNLDTYTIRFENAEFDESALAEIVSKKYNTNHHCYTVNSADLKKLLAEMMWYFDEPLGDSGILPNYILNQFVRKNNTKVILSGAGGDELFAGYTYYFGNKKEQFASRFPYALRLLSNLISKRNVKLSEQLLRASYLKEDPVKHLVLQEHAFSDAEVVQLLGITGSDIKYDYGKKFEGSNLNKQLYTDIKTYLSDDLLLLSDRSCMSSSVEGRVPFLYTPLVEYALSIPDNIKAPEGQRKWIMKEIAKDFLPQELLNTPKMGFCSPINNWMKSDFGDFVFDLLNSKRSIEREWWKHPYFEEFVSDRTNYDTNFNKIYLLLILEMFFRIHIDTEVDSIDKINLENVYAG